MLSIKNLTKSYNGRTIFKDLSFTVAPGEVLTIVGPSGIGKTTFLNILAGLIPADSGSIELDGKELSKLNENQLAVFRRRKIGFVFQNYNLIPLLSVYENIILPRQLDGKKADYKFVEELLSLLGLKEKME